MTSKFVELKRPKEIEIMKEGAKITLNIIAKTRERVKIGMTTAEVDNIIGKYIKEANCEPAFLGYKTKSSQSPFPSNACLCLNNEIFHSPASNKIIKFGDLLTIDLGLKYKGLFSDCAMTFVIGEINDRKNRLIDACGKAIEHSLSYCVPGNTTNDITKAIDLTVRDYGYVPAESYGGHSIGSQMHMVPYVSNSKSQSIECELAEGMVLCLEPSALEKQCTLTIGLDGWTVFAPENILSAHVERMVEITKTGGIIL